MDALWTYTQTPTLHERWDLRFSQIAYLPKERESEPQRFRYATRIGLGLEVAGEGESVGERDNADRAGGRTSALKFGSDDHRSIIREGSGYWRYIPTSDGIRFLTWYDYRTRFGPLGALFDKIVFRPIIGWATAWSFDRLRLWLEDRIEPAYALRQALVHGVARIGLAFVFAYHGLVPKLLTRHPDEVAMLRDAGVSAPRAEQVVVLLGTSELAFALVLLLLWRRRWPSLVSLVLMPFTTLGVALASPRFLGAAFNPVSLNVLVACLAAIDLLVLAGVPSAAHCRRRPAETGA